MKTKKSSAAKRARSIASHKRQRPLHKRVLLHPFSAFVLLCVGVLAIGSTWTGWAESYDVTATVSAPAATQPAVIAKPTNGQHVTTQPIDIQGTCPAQSYVKLYRDESFSGTAVCAGGHFGIKTSLSIGANQLLARVFNLTDQEGPDSTLITIYYDLLVSVRPPASLPTSLQISEYSQGAVRELGSHPTISGLAPPFSDVTVTFYSVPSVCKTKADARGVWSCTLPNALPPGLHHVEIVAVTPAGKKLTFPTFQIVVRQDAPALTMTSDYKYQAYRQGQSASWKLALAGGRAPYQVVVDWGDGSTSRLARQDQAEFTISHTYQSPEVSDEQYAVVVTAKDASGTTTVLQLSAAIKSTALAASGQRSLWLGFVASVQQWLWVVWPVYIAVVLMALSFWIGEREAYQRFMARKRGRPPVGKLRTR